MSEPTKESMDLSTEVEDEMKEEAETEAAPSPAVGADEAMNVGEPLVEQVATISEGELSHQRDVAVAMDVACTSSGPLTIRHRLPKTSDTKSGSDGSEEKTGDSCSSFENDESSRSGPQGPNPMENFNQIFCFRNASRGQSSFDDSDATTASSETWSHHEETTQDIGNSVADIDENSMASNSSEAARANERFSLHRSHSVAESSDSSSFSDPPSSYSSSGPSSAPTEEIPLYLIGTPQTSNVENSATFRLNPEPTEIMTLGSLSIQEEVTPMPDFTVATRSVHSESLISLETSVSSQTPDVARIIPALSSVILINIIHDSDSSEIDETPADRRLQEESSTASGNLASTTVESRSSLLVGTSALKRKSQDSNCESEIDQTLTESGSSQIGETPPKRKKSQETTMETETSTDRSVSDESTMDPRTLQGSSGQFRTSLVVGGKAKKRKSQETKMDTGIGESGTKQPDSSSNTTDTSAKKRKSQEAGNIESSIEQPGSSSNLESSTDIQTTPETGTSLTKTEQ